jgi:hypothetical protein
MRTIIVFGIAALLTLAGIVSWVTATARSNNETNALSTSRNSINPLDLMKNSKNLRHEQYDAF